MADRSSPIQLEDVPLDEARRLGRGPRMDPDLYHALKDKLPSLGTLASRMALPPGTSPTTMKHRILRVAAELGIPVTVRRVPVGLLFWRSTEEDIQQAKAIGARLQNARARQKARANSRQRAPARARRSS